jgi:hypothetical protein
MSGDTASSASSPTTPQAQGDASASASASGEGTSATQTVDAAKYEKALERARRFEGELVDTKKQLDAIKAQLNGIDFEEYKALKAEREQLMAERAKNNPEEMERQYAAREAKLRKDLGAEKAALEEENARLKSELKTERVTKNVMGRIGPKLHPEFHRFVQADVERFMDMQDGEIVIRDEKGTIRYSRVNPGEYMQPEEWAEELAKVAPRMFVSEAVGGTKPASGTKPAVTNGQTSTPADFALWPKDRQTEFFRSNPKALENFMNNFSPKV